MAPGGPDELVPEWDQADKMRKALRHAGVSVQEIADYLGVARNTVSTWINGHIPPSTQTVRLWSIRTGVPYEWLMGAEQARPAQPSRRRPVRARADSNRRPEDYKSPTSVIIDLTAERARRRTSTRDVELPHVAKVLQFPSRMLAAA